MSKLESRYPKMVVMVRIRNPDRSLVKEFTFNYHVNQERQDFASKIVDAYLAHQSVETFALLGNSLQHVMAGVVPSPVVQEEKTYNFYFKGKTVPQRLKGHSPKDAFTKAGYGAGALAAGALAAVDYYEEDKA